MMKIITIHSDDDATIVAIGQDVERALDAHGYDADDIDYSVDESARILNR